jgi:hypothetical protein
MQSSIGSYECRSDDDAGHAVTVDPKALAVENWFGYGRWDAPYWFVGMEPGGDDHPELYTAWQAAGGGSLIDAAEHEEQWNLRVPAHLQMHHFATKPVIQKGTWQPLIYIVLGFNGEDADSHTYQRDRLGRARGDMALIELCSVAAKNLAIPGDRDRFMPERIDFIKRQLKTNAVEIAVFYGTTYREKYEQIAGRFNRDGLRWRGRTLCALINHPSRPSRKYAYWRVYGEMLRKVYEAGSGLAATESSEKR